MDIWKALPPETNTLYVVKVPNPGTGLPIVWSPDPGTRVKVYAGSWLIATPGLGAVRQPRVRLLYGSDIVLSHVGTRSLPPGVTFRVSIGKGSRTDYGVNDVDTEIYWDSGIYLTSDFTLEFGGTAIESLDVYTDGVIYIDTWHDMTITTGGKD